MMKSKNIAMNYIEFFKSGYGLFQRNLKVSKDPNLIRNEEGKLNFTSFIEWHIFYEKKFIFLIY